MRHRPGPPAPRRSTRTRSTIRLPETWKTDPEPLNIERAHQNTVLLPDGSMVTVGGGIGKDVDNVAPDLQQWGAEPDQKKVELWNPTDGTWSYGAAQQEFRTYHSTAVLLPDGRVVSAGDDFNGGFNQDTAEIYEPPYLFKGPRPVISSGPQVGVLDQSLEVATPNPGYVDHAALVAPGATTHANDMNQRYYALTTTPGRRQGLDGLCPTENAVPPGWYMLFLLSDDGVPSIAHWIRIGPASTPQPGQIVVEQRAAAGRRERVLLRRSAVRRLRAQRRRNQGDDRAGRRLQRDPGGRAGLRPHLDLLRRRCTESERDRSRGAQGNGPRHGRRDRPLQRSRT